MIQIEEKIYAAMCEEQLTLRDENRLMKAELEWYRQKFLLSQQRQFGISSESTSGQGVLVFNEAEQAEEPALPEAAIEIPAHKRKVRGQRNEMLKDLPVEEVHYHLPESELTCPSCQSEMHRVGSDDREEVEITPPVITVKKHCVSKYCCRNCQNDGHPVKFKTAAAPKSAFPGSFASPSLVAYIISQKFVMGMPLYRLEKEMHRQKFGLSRATMANWMIGGAKNLEPIHSRMKEHLTNLDILHADETTMQVLKEPGRQAISKSYMWLYRSGRYGPPIVIYDYQMTREGIHPKQFLKNFAGFLHVDGYVGYDRLHNVTSVGCWAHARRKFFDAWKILPVAAKDKGGTATHVGLDYCNRLYAIEQKLQKKFDDLLGNGKLTDEQRVIECKETRIEHSKPLLDKFQNWLDVQSVNCLPQSLIGKAVAYCRNQWPKLTVFLQDGRLEIDNNRAERAIKPFVIGRKNWLFANTSRGATSSAILYSIVETAKQNDLNPFKYLTYLFETLPNVDIHDEKTVDTLMPWSAEIQLRFNPPSPEILSP